MYIWYQRQPIITKHIRLINLFSIPLTPFCFSQIWNNSHRKPDLF